LEQGTNMQVAKHALLWVSAGIGLDYATSWSMMSSLGATAEGSVVTRDFFVSPNVLTLAALLESQATWILIFAVSLTSFLVFRYNPKAFDKPPLSNQKAFLGLASIIAWWFGAYRAMIGPTSNVSAFIATAYGHQVGDNAYEVLIVIAAAVAALDFIRVLVLGLRRGSRISRFTDPAATRG
jgi:hypothetical protein